jgi:hypothetical protein
LSSGWVRSIRALPLNCGLSAAKVELVDVRVPRNDPSISVPRGRVQRSPAEACVTSGRRMLPPENGEAAGTSSFERVRSPKSSGSNAPASFICVPWAARNAASAARIVRAPGHRRLQCVAESDRLSLDLREREGEGAVGRSLALETRALNRAA